MSGFAGGHPACANAIIQDEGAHFVQWRSSKRTKALMGNYKNMALNPCKSIKALISTKALMHTQSMSRFHRPLRGKSTCARKVRNAVTDFCA
jgi:hypothetical protein